jgi:hypothetical protein
MLLTRTNNSVGKQAQFEQRLLLCGFSKKQKALYNVWSVNAYLFVRTHVDSYSIHLFEDIEHYEVYRRTYKDILYNCNNEEFVFNLLQITVNRLKNNDTIYRKRPQILESKI